MFLDSGPSIPSSCRSPNPSLSSLTTPETQPPSCDLICIGMAPLIFLIWIQNTKGWCLLTFYPSYQLTHPHLLPQNALTLIIMSYPEHKFIHTYWLVILSVHFSIYTKEFTRTHVVISIVGNCWGNWCQDCEIHYSVPSTTSSLSGVTQWTLQLTTSCCWMQNVGRRGWSRCKFENFSL